MQHRAPQARSVGFPRRTDPWACAAVARLVRNSGKMQSSLELLLERRDRECFHNSPGWLRLDLHLLAESHSRTCLGGRLVACLDHANAWDHEFASLFSRNVLKASTDD